jgi:transposase InsO family protein
MRGKVNASVHTPVQPIEVPTKRFSHIHVDIVGPLPATAGGFSYLFTVVDRSTRWPEAIPLKGISTGDCIEAFLAGWVGRFGIPTTMTSDRGVQFTSAVWQNMCNQLGIQHKLTTAYHPQANGMVERFHRQLKASLRARLFDQQWMEHLPWVLLGLRAAPKEDCGFSSAEMVYGAPLTLPGEFLGAEEAPSPALLADLRAKMIGFQPPGVRRPPPAASSGLPPNLLQAEMVYIRRGGGH